MRRTLAFLGLIVSSALCFLVGQHAATIPWKWEEAHSFAFAYVLAKAPFFGLIISAESFVFGRSYMLCYLTKKIRKFRAWFTVT